MNKKFLSSPGLLFMILSAILVISKNKAEGLVNTPSNGNFFTVRIGNGEDISGISPQVRVNDPKYRYSSDQIERVGNKINQLQGDLRLTDTDYLGQSQSNIVRVQLNPRSASGFLLRGNVERISSTEGESSPSASPSIEWDQVHSQTPKTVVVATAVPAGGKNVRRIQNILVQEDVGQLREDQVINPPPHEDIAKMARFIVRKSNWTSMATISSRKPTAGYPFANIFSISDGPTDSESTGIPYMYLTPMEISVKDLQENSKASLTMSLAQGDYCRLHDYDAEDPRCAHVILTGTMVKIENSTREAGFAQKALFSRHPEMPDWPQDHGWFFAKLRISNILVLDYFGGAKSVTPEQYFQANSDY